jgi:putative alpha-1,2-mannosidase
MIVFQHCVLITVGWDSMQYAFDDFAIAQAAKVLGKNEDAEKIYYLRSMHLRVWHLTWWCSI